MWGSMGQLWGAMGCLRDSYRALWSTYGALLGRSFTTPQLRLTTNFFPSCPRSPIHVLNVRSPDMASSCAASHREELKGREGTKNVAPAERGKTPPTAHRRVASKKSQGGGRGEHKTRSGEDREWRSPEIGRSLEQRSDAFTAPPSLVPTSSVPPRVYTLSYWFPPPPLLILSPSHNTPLLGSSPHSPPLYCSPPITPSHCAPPPHPFLSTPPVPLPSNLSSSKTAIFGCRSDATGSEPGSGVAPVGCLATVRPSDGEKP